MTKPFSILLSAFFIIFLSVSIFFHSLSVSFLPEANANRVFEEYRQSASCFALRKNDVSFQPTPGSSFYQTRTGIYQISEEEGLGNRFVAVLETEDFSLFRDRLTQGTLPDVPGEMMISSFAADFLKEAYSIEDVLGFDLSDFTASSPAVVVGVFQGEDAANYAARKRLVDGYQAPSSYLISYGFLSEVIFTYGTNTFNPRYLLQTEENRSRLTPEDVVDFSLYQEADFGFPYAPIEVTKDGATPFQNMFFLSTSSSLLFSILFLAFSFLLSFLFPFLFFLRQRRRILLLRVSGRSRKELNREALLGLFVPGLVGVTLGYVFGLALVLGFQGYYSSILVASPWIFQMSWWGLLPPALILLVLGLFSALMVDRVLSPQDLSRLLSEVKRKG